MAVNKYPTNQQEILYQKNANFTTGITIGGAVRDGAALTLMATKQRFTPRCTPSGQPS